MRRRRPRRAADGREDVASVLQAELAPLEAWIEVTEAYLRRGDARGFETLMEMVCAPGAWTRARDPTGRDGERAKRTTPNERKRANACAIERGWIDEARTASTERGD